VGKHSNKYPTCGNAWTLAAIFGYHQTMKSLFIIFLLSLSLNSFSQRNLDSLDKANRKSIELTGSFVTKAMVDTDNIIWLKADIKRDHRFFGYEKPNTKSKRLILFSILTNDVEDNPFGCTFGAFYETAGLDSLGLIFESNKGSFIKTKLVRPDFNNTVISYIFFERKWFTFKKRNA